MVWRVAVAHLRSRFAVGLLVLAPIVLTYFVLRTIFDWLDGVLAPLVDRVLGRDIPGLGLAALIAIVYITGLIGANFIGRSVLRALQRLLLSIPVVRSIYGIVHQLVDSLSGGKPTGLSRVVMLEYPRAGMWAVGFLTGFTSGGDGERLAVIYIPTTPTPTSGWLAMVPLADVYDTDLTTQMTMQMVLSGGIVYPEQIKRRPLPEAEPAMAASVEDGHAAR